MMDEKFYTLREWLNTMPLSDDELRTLQACSYLDMPEPTHAFSFKIYEQLRNRGYLITTYADGNICQIVYRITEAGKEALKT